MTSLSKEQLAQVERFVESLQLSDQRLMTPAVTKLSEPAFELIWNNPEDEAYDAL